VILAKTAIAVGGVTVASLMALAAARGHQYNTPVELSLDGSECKGKATHKQVVADTGGRVEWYVRNVCTDNRAHEFKIEFVKSTCASNSQLSKTIPAYDPNNPDVYHTLFCVVKHNPGGGKLEGRDYRIYVDGKVHDPVIVIRGKGGLRALLWLLLQHLYVSVRPWLA
jgi:hypothetical protein